MSDAGRLPFEEPTGILLVTGGAGFIGGNFVLGAVAAGQRVVNLDALTYAGNLDTLASVHGDPRHTFVQGDICDRELVSRLLAEHRPRAIVNFAAESHVDRSIDGPAAFIQTNVVGTLALLEAALGHWTSLEPSGRATFRFLHVSTDEVYGSLGEEGCFVESTPYAPNSPYSASKAASDHLVRAFHHTYGLPVLTSHCSNNYGPYQFPEKLIPLIVTNLMEGKNVPLYGDGLNVRDWLHVDDHCAGIALALQKGRSGEVYNIGGGTELTNLALTHRLLTAMGADESAVETVPDRKGHDRRYSLDISKIHEELGYSPQIDLDRGLADTIEWYRTNAAWWEPLRQRS